MEPAILPTVLGLEVKLAAVAQGYAMPLHAHELWSSNLGENIYTHCSTEGSSGSQKYQEKKMVEDGREVYSYPSPFVDKLDSLYYKVMTIQTQINCFVVSDPVIRDRGTHRYPIT